MPTMFDRHLTDQDKENLNIIDAVENGIGGGFILLDSGDYVVWEYKERKA